MEIQVQLRDFMSLALTFDKLRGIPDTTQAEEFVQGVITFSGSYVTGGDTLSLPEPIRSNRAPRPTEWRFMRSLLLGHKLRLGSTSSLPRERLRLPESCRFSAPNGNGDNRVNFDAPTITTGNQCYGDSGDRNEWRCFDSGGSRNGITGVQAPIITSTFTGSGSGAAQLAAGAYGSHSPPPP